jgi:hypothetical protein
MAHAPASDPMPEERRRALAELDAVLERAEGSDIPPLAGPVPARLSVWTAPGHASVKPSP